MKKLFGLFTFILIGLISFGYCDYLDGLQFVTNINHNNYTVYSETFGNLGFPTTTGQACFNIKNYGGTDRLRIFINGTKLDQLRYQAPSTFRGLNLICIPVDGDFSNINLIISDYNNNGVTFNIDLYYLPSNSMEIISGNPGYTSLQCQQEYNLIPISSVDQNYCTTNGLCPSGGGDCPVCPGSGDNWSALYINDIQHLGKPIINVTIPDYITWDYTTNENEFNLYCGSGYDEDYINSVIAINSYRPDSGDFTNIFVSGLTLVFPYIVIVLFIVFVRRLLKRIFR